MKNVKMKKEQYTTMDAYQTAFLSTRGFIPRLISEGTKIVFGFDLTDKLMTALSEYNGGELVRANEFVITIKLLKSRVFAMKRENEERRQTNGKDSRE
jgi:hypothetical protein